MRFLDIEPGYVRRLEPYGTLPETAHVFDRESIDAIDAALAARRPLLVRGEPGTGKSQLARAAASALGRAFLPFTVDARTEARDLLYTVDTVARLADAQVAGHLPRDPQRDLRRDLAEIRYTTPGPLWWAFDWSSALRQAALAHGIAPPSDGGARGADGEQAEEARALTPWTPRGWSEGAGVVVLVDEIDKADPAVPNGLLEALGQGEFRPPGGEPVAARKSPAAPPLVVITTNEERTLPDAFVRRCLVLQLAWPGEREKLIEALVARGRAHFDGLAAAVFQAAAEMVADDREEVARRGLCPPGGAEYLDLLRAVGELAPRNAKEQRAILDRIRGYALRKHPDEPAW
jgi:MoxR-like ATPase